MGSISRTVFSLNAYFSVGFEVHSLLILHQSRFESLSALAGDQVIYPGYSGFHLMLLFFLTIDRDAV